MAQVEPSMIKLHKRPSINPTSSSSSSTSSAADIIRATVEISLPSNLSQQGSKDLLEAFKVALKTPQLRPTCPFSSLSHTVAIATDCRGTWYEI